MFGQVRARYKQISNNRGQLAVEYVLLVIIAVAIATTIVSTMVSRDEEEPGFLIRAWQGITETISQDNSGEAQ